MRLANDFQCLQGYHTCCDGMTISCCSRHLSLPSTLSRLSALMREVPAELTLPDQRVSGSKVTIYRCNAAWPTSLLGDGDEVLVRCCSQGALCCD